MPFALNDSTRFISPIKTLEYFAGGKPVISTAVPDVVALHAGVARIATDHANFIALCEATLADEEVQRIARCEATASAVRGTSWDRTAERARHLIETLLATPAAARQASAAGTSAHGITPHPWGGFGAATQQATVAAR